MARKNPTTTKWVDCVKKDDEGQEFLRCRLVARDFKLRHEGSRYELCVAMPPLEAPKALFAHVAGSRRASRDRGDHEVKFMFVDLVKVHFNARCDEEEGLNSPTNSVSTEDMPE